MCKNFMFLIIGVGLILLGLTGRYVLRGTDSSLLLALVGLVVVMYCILRIIFIIRADYVANSPYNLSSKMFPDVLKSARNEGTVSAEVADYLEKEYERQKYYLIYNNLSPSERKLKFMELLFFRKHISEQGSAKFSIQEINDLIYGLPITTDEVEESLFILYKDKKEHISMNAEASVIAGYDLGINLVNEYIRMKPRSIDANSTQAANKQGKSGQAITGEESELLSQ